MSGKGEQGGFLGRLVGRPLFWVAFISPLFLLSLARGLTSPEPEMPPVLGQLPDFRLVNERGEPFGLADLRGKVFIANFIFTSCVEACPRLTAEMGKIQYRTRNLRDALMLVSFSVDPKTDTPEVLAKYAREHKAAPNRWTFLTGPLEDIDKVVTEGFKIAMGPDEVFGTYHGEHFVLVDAKGQIRGYYEASPEGEDELVRVAGLLVNRPGY